MSSHSGDDEEPEPDRERRTLSKDQGKLFQDIIS